jgi:hypothetical protein
VATIGFSVLTLPVERGREYTHADDQEVGDPFEERSEVGQREDYGIEPGDIMTVTVVLDRRSAVQNGMLFAIRDGRDESQCVAPGAAL